jgi:hypothetical protein
VKNILQELVCSKIVQLGGEISVKIANLAGLKLALAKHCLQNEKIIHIFAAIPKVSGLPVNLRSSAGR